MEEDLGEGEGQGGEVKVCFGSLALGDGRPCCVITSAGEADWTCQS